MWFFTTMRSAGTPIDRHQAQTQILRTGPFRFTRNPGYLGMGLVYAGLSLLLGGRWSLLLLPGALVTAGRGVVRREEAYLAERFGAPYARCRSPVRRSF